MSRQRTRGQKATVFPRKETIDSRGNPTLIVDLSSPIEVTAAFIPQRSSKAEVPGQQQIDVVRMIVSHNLENVGLWGRVYYANDEWDIAAPPAYHHGTRRTRHLSIDIRKRP